MGASDVIPGVSGGTIAFISGIYERLINAIKNINFKNIKLIFKGQIKAFWKNIDANFLIALVLGIAVSFLSLAKLMTYLIENHCILVWAFFFGLVLASTIFVGKTVKWNFKTILTFIVFTAVAFFITSPSNQPMHTGDDLWFIFICGVIAICAMILPGISGSFILLLLGKYHYMLKALTEINLPVIIVFIVGAFIGITSFSNILNWLFKKFKMITLAALTGFMFGSLNKIWPWKQVVETYTDNEGLIKPLVEKNILPTSNFEVITGSNPQIWQAIALLIAGFALIFIIEFIAEKAKKVANTNN